MYQLLIIILIVLTIVLIIKDNNNNDILVNVENFIKVETYMYMGKYFDKIRETNTFLHYRDFEVDNSVVRMNLDTLYSISILDTKKSGIKIVLPVVEDRYISCCVLDNHHNEVLFTKRGGEYNFPQSDQYLVCIIRILVKNRTEEDINIVNKIQDKIYIKSDYNNPELDIPKYDQKSYLYTKDLINKLFETTPNMSSIGMFGKKGEYNELKHLMGVTMGWGGLSEKQAYYISRFPENNNGTQEYSLTFRDVPVKAFWSIIVYDKNGYIIKDKKQSLNNFTTKPDIDGNYTINFSNDFKKPNNLNIVNGWNYTIRLYESEEQILNGEWTFPELQEL
jgi:hypothetical protein